MSTQTTDIYQPFLSKLTAKQWKKLGIQRRSGVVTPLFSIYSQKSIGIGEIPDLKLLIDWCKSTGLSMIQLLPMNDVGYDFRPYDAASSFALEPVYLSLENLKGVIGFKTEIKALRTKFPIKGLRVDYGIKRAKMDLLWQIFQSSKTKKGNAFKAYIKRNIFWLKPYALFKVIKELKNSANWQDWDIIIKRKDPGHLEGILEQNQLRIEFYYWLQWQLFEEFSEVKKYAADNGILIIGDIPFLVSRDSADVWWHQEYFDLNSLSGAPPDLYFAKGQRWGMPTYRWDRIAEHGYDYLIEKLKYAENFYDAFRIDHIVGIFRVWTIALNEPVENAGLNGYFNPRDEAYWEAHGRTLLIKMIEATDMLPCGEDLGTVPACSYKVLADLGIPGINVQRWSKDWTKTGRFTAAEDYRINSCAVLSTHDSSSFLGWWLYEAGTIDEILFERKCREKGIDYGAVRSRLFDLNKSRYGRLRWRDEISSPSIVARELGRSELEVSDLIELYIGTYQEKNKYWEFLEMTGPMQEKPSHDLCLRALEKLMQTASIFSLPLLQDWLMLGHFPIEDIWQYRINFPGTVDSSNWSLLMPFSLEQMLKLEINQQIDNLNRVYGRK